MGRMAALAERHWQTFLPEAYAAIKDPATFFQEKEDEAQEQIDLLSDDLTPPPQPGETWLQSAARLSTGRTLAESVVFREVLMPDPATPEPESPEDREIVEATREFERLRETLGR